MTTNRETVTLSGRLVGMGRDVSCSVRAVKVSLRGNGGTVDFTYTRPVIFDAPSDLPDGPYTLTYDGQTVKVQQVNGSWLARVA